MNYINIEFFVSSRETFQIWGEVLKICSAVFCMLNENSQNTIRDENKKEKKGTKNVQCLGSFYDTIIVHNRCPLIEFLGYKEKKKREVSVHKTFRNHPLTTPQPKTTIRKTMKTEQLTTEQDQQIDRMRTR